MELSGAVALVTGAGSGLGYAVAEAMAAKGASIVAHYHRSSDSAHALARRVGEGEAMAVHADLRSPGELRMLLERGLQRFGRLDILVNNAATLVRTPLGTLDAQVWDDIHAVNLRAPALLAAIAGPVMQSQARGVIVNIGDLAGIEPWPAYLAHASAKAGLHHLTRCLALALAPTVRVNAVAPGLVDSPPGWSTERIERFRRRIPRAHLTTVDEVVGAVLTVIQNDAITGQVLVVDGGQSLAF